MAGKVYKGSSKWVSQNIDNKNNKSNPNNKKDTGPKLSLWVKTSPAGNIEEMIKHHCLESHMNPRGKINYLWECLHNEMGRCIECYEFSQFDQLRNYIYDNADSKFNDDKAMISLTKKYKFKLQILSLNTDFKPIILGSNFSMKISLLHIGYNYFTALVPGRDCDYQLEKLPDINSKSENPSGNRQKEKDQKLLKAVQEKMLGREKVQNLSEIRHMSSKKKPYYDTYSAEELKQKKNLKRCTLHIKNAHLAIANVIQKKDKNEKDITIIGRKNCGYNAFEGDTVLVEINDPMDVTGKVVSVEHSYHKPINSIYICKPSRDQGSHMMPLDGSFSKILVDNEPGRRRYEKDLKQRPRETFAKEQLSDDIMKRESSRFADNIYVSIFGIDFSKNVKTVKFKDPYIEKIDTENCEKLFLVYYEKWDIAFMYPHGRVIGMVSTYDSFKDSLHLISALCKIEPHIANDAYKKEVKDIEKEVKKVKQLSYDVVPEGAMVFTIDNEETRDMDDAISYHIEDESTVIGVHITDITRYISPQHLIFKDAMRRFSTAYIPHDLKEDNICLIDKGLSTSFLSLVPNQPRAVISVMFHFDKSGSHLPHKVNIKETFITSKYKLNYKEVEGWIDAPRKPVNVSEHLFIAVNGCYKIAKEIRQARLPNSFFVRQADHSGPGFQIDDSFNAEFLIEEFMIMANEHVAKKIYERYPNMTLLRTQNPVVDYKDWEKKVFKDTNTNIPSSLMEYCNLLDIKKTVFNDKNLVVSLQYYNDLSRFIDENQSLANNMIRYDEYISDIYVHLCEWRKLCAPAKYECSIQGSVDNGHFSLNKDMYTHFTSPIRRFCDVIVHIMLKSILNERSLQIDEKLISEACTIANERIKNNHKFEKYCSVYEIFEGSRSVHNFTLDCTCINFTNEELQFVHPSLEKSESIKYLKFSHLSLNTPPVQLNGNESSETCSLKWMKKIYSWTKTMTQRFVVNIDHQILNATLPRASHELLTELRTSYLSPKERSIKLKKLKKEFSTKTSTDILTCNCSTDPPMEINLNLHIKSIIRIQFCSYKVHGLKRVQPELLVVHPSLQLCLLHQQDSVMCFVPGGKLALGDNDIVWKFKDTTHYINYFMPLLQLESLEEVIKEKSEYTLLDVPIHWMNNKSKLTMKNEIFGIIKFDMSVDEHKNISFSDESDEVLSSYDDIIGKGLRSETKDLICLRAKIKDQDNYWVGHGTVVNNQLFKDEDTEKVYKVVMIILTQSDFDIFNGHYEKLTFTLEVYFRTISASRQLDAVNSCSEVSLLEDIILGKNIEREDGSDLPDVFKEFNKLKILKLNTSQETAIYKAFTEKVSLIWGPPGTGKTSIGCILAYCFCIRNNNSDGVVVYCGPSNDCVNLVIDSMKSKFGENCPNMLRIFSKQQEMADFPLPGHVSNCKKLPKSLQSTSFHHLIRQEDTQIASEIRKLDAIFEKFLEPTHIYNEKDHSGKTIYQLKMEYKKLIAIAKEEHIESNKYKMVVCTTSVSGSYIMKKFTVLQIIIDEAGMCKEPETLVPILKAKKTVKNVVLIGDHKQLRPIILDDLASKRGLQISFFERYQRMKPDLVTMLDQQYRMHPSICEFPSQYFYSKCLQTEPSHKWSGLKPKNFINEDYYKQWNGVDYRLAKRDYQADLRSSTYSAIPDEKWPGKRKKPYLSFQPSFNLYPERLVFIDVVGDEMVQSVSTSACSENSRSNIKEITAVVYVYDKLISKIGFKNGKYPSEHITVLTQYRLQESKLMEACKKVLNKIKACPEPIVKTVIKSQGSENDYVIFSTVRSLRKCDIMENPSPGWENKYLGFITDHNQVNVALTRAQKGLIIIGNMALLSVNKMWRALLTDLQSRGCVLSRESDFI